MNKRSRLSVARVVAGLILGSTLTLAASVPSSAAEQCMPRFIAQNIEDAVMALTASRYCEDLPYTIAEASIRVDLMRSCNSDASTMIDQMLVNEDHYRMIFTSDPTHVACQAAANIALN